MIILPHGTGIAQMFLLLLFFSHTYFHLGSTNLLDLLCALIVIRWFKSIGSENILFDAICTTVLNIILNGYNWNEFNTYSIQKENKNCQHSIHKEISWEKMSALIWHFTQPLVSWGGVEKNTICLSNSPQFPIPGNYCKDL